jgi:ribosomal protein S18 acetylase RimI-like enzyme
MPAHVDPQTIRDLLRHEALVHALPRRYLRDLGDSIFLHDPDDPEPFWNRLVAVRWPDDPVAFDRRLTEMLVLFTSVGRQPHIWPSPVHDQPADLVQRLQANGFMDTGKGMMMLYEGADAAGPPEPPLTGSVTMDRVSGIDPAAAMALAPDILEVLADAFEIAPEREPAIREDTVTALGHDWFTYYLVRIEGRPAAVARRATFDGLTYLTSIGTARWARGRGLGRLVSAAATRDGLAARSRVHLGVFADNAPAIHLYEALGFARIGVAVPDLLLV